MTTPRLVSSRYELDGIVGRGGMAEVYRGRDVRLDRLVAVKTLRADLSRDPTFQTRFRREAQSAASLNHPAIIAVYDTGEDVINGTSVPYIVMEYVEGHTLRELLQGDRRLLPERAMEITDGVLRALDYSHANGIVHRDIKPANVMFTPSGEVKVMDFGIARAVHDASATVTQTAQVIGTAQYLSPEQARGERVDARSDIYSTGCLLYELLVGSPPFKGDSPVAIAYQHVREEPVPPSHIDPDIPPWADAIVLRSLAKDPSERYQNAADMRADIGRALAGQPVAAPPAMMPAAPTQQFGHTQSLPPATDLGPEPPERRRWPWFVLLAVIMVALAALAGWWLVRDLGASGTETVRVPNVVGQPADDAKQALRQRDLQPRVKYGYSDDYGKGFVFDQVPGPRSEADPGATVVISVSKGSRSVAVPHLIGLSRSEAENQLENRNLEVGDVVERASVKPADTVLSSNPPGGQTVQRGTAVDLTVSEGPQQVPNVVGKTIEDAEAILSDQGFGVDEQPSPDPNAPEGIVADQDPDAGSQVAGGTTVTVFVGQAPEPEPSPSAPPPGHGNGNGDGDGDDDDGGILPG